MPGWRFGIPGSALFASSTTVTSAGAVSSAHDSCTALGGGVAVFGVRTGETALREVCGPAYETESHHLRVHLVQPRRPADPTG